MEVLSIQDIDFWEYNIDKGTKLLFSIYHNIKQEKTGDILICRDDGYNLCLKFQNDYFLTISTILTRLKNLSHYYEADDSAAYFTNDDYVYHIYKHDDNSYILTVNYHNHNILNDNCRCFQKRSEYIRENNLKNIENIIIMEENYNNMVYDDKEFKSFEEIFEYGLSLCEWTKKKQAHDFFNAYIYYLYYVNSREDVPTIEYAEQRAKNNFGYFAGYYGDNVRKKIYDYFGAVHPVFGNRYNVTNKEAFYAGMQKANAKNKNTINFV